MAEDASHLPGTVAVIHTDALGRLLADGANPILPHEHVITLSKRDPITTLQIAFGAVGLLARSWAGKKARLAV